MKSEKLMLGNYFQDQNGNLLVVDELTSENVIFKVVDRSKFPLPDGWKAEPITTTDFWLYDLGFTYKAEFEAFVINNGQPNEMIINLVNGVYHVCDMENTPEIGEVHKLQNLCSSLIDTILTIKESETTHEGTISAVLIKYDDLPDENGNVFKKGCFDESLAAHMSGKVKFAEDEKGLHISVTPTPKTEGK